MLPEGSEQAGSVQTEQDRDQSDYFGLLMMTAGNDTIGAVTVLKTEDECVCQK